MREKNVWWSSCSVCGTSIENRGSGRPRSRCSSTCKAEANRRTASKHYYAKRGRRKPRIKPLRLPKSIRTIRTRQRDERLIIEEKLRRGSCLSCGLLVTEENWIVFDFDHRERHTKNHNISRLKGRSTTSDQLIEEMAKCDLLCAICHRRKTYDERDFVPTQRRDVHPSLFDN